MCHHHCGFPKSAGHKDPRGKEDVPFQRITNIWTAVNECQGNTEVQPVKQGVRVGGSTCVYLNTHMQELISRSKLPAWNGNGFEDPKRVLSAHCN